MNRRAALICLLLGTVVVAVVFLLVPSHNAIRLPDGGEVRLAAVTHGTVHQYFGGGWRNRLLRFLPDKIGRRFRTRGGSIVTAGTNVVFWFERSGGEMPLITVRDRDGVEYGEPACRLTTGTGTEAEWLEGVGFSVVPRRERAIHLRLYERLNVSEAGRFLAELTVQNPLWRTHPVWAPEPLPATRETNGLSITLRELTTGERWHGPFDDTPPAQPADIGVRVVFDISQKGVPTDAWEPIPIETSDATGNVAHHRERGSHRDSGRHTVRYLWGLWPSEAAWKLKVQIARRAGFAADQLWMVRGLSLGEVILDGDPNRRAELPGASLELHRIEPNHFQPGRWIIHVRVQPFRNEYRLALVEASDDKGRRVPNPGEGSASGNYTFDLAPEADAQSLDLMFAMSRNYLVEFIAKPDLVRTRNAATNLSEARTVITKELR